MEGENNLQLVVYNAALTGGDRNEAAPDAIDSQGRIPQTDASLAGGDRNEPAPDITSPQGRVPQPDAAFGGGDVNESAPEGPRPHGRVSRPIGDFAIQCDNCFKWRRIPTEEKYEEIREHITARPFVCDDACEWRPDLRCGDPSDIEQDGSRLWAIDVPDIARPPRGWKRVLYIRAEGGTKFADVTYKAPSRKRLRSMAEVERYLHEHPEYIEQGVSLSQFSFQSPKPLQKDYVRTRTRARDANNQNSAGSDLIVVPLPMVPYDGESSKPSDPTM